MPEFVSRKAVTARRVHRCDYCGAVAVKRGEIYSREVLKYDGRIYSWVTCGRCAELAHEVWLYCGESDDGTNGDDFAEWAEESKDDPEWGERARAFLKRAASAREDVTE
jgi:hypothetical protein